MASTQQIAANRRNASRSTGPRTAAGKARTASNARRHGFTVRAPEAEVTEMMTLILGDISDELSSLAEVEWEATAELARAELALARVREYQALLFEERATPTPVVLRYRSEAESRRRTAFRLWAQTLTERAQGVTA